MRDNTIRTIALVFSLVHSSLAMSNDYEYDVRFGEETSTVERDTFTWNECTGVEQEYELSREVSNARVITIGNKSSASLGIL